MDKWAYEHGVELDFRRPGKPMTMRRSRALTVDSVRSACTLTGSCPLPMQKPRSRSGGSTIMRRVPTLHCSGPHHQNSPVRQGFWLFWVFFCCWFFFFLFGFFFGVGSAIESSSTYMEPMWGFCLFVV